MPIQEGIQLTVGTLLSHRSFGVGEIVSLGSDGFFNIDFPGRQQSPMSERIVRDRCDVVEGFHVPTGSLVSHRNFGVGEVSSLTEDHRVLVTFSETGDQTFGALMAKNELAIVPGGGLKERQYYNSESLNELARTSPLRLLALVLTDLGREGKHKTLKGLLENSNLISTPWSAWWKMVRGMAQESKSFEVKKDGSVLLVVESDQVESEPLRKPGPIQAKIKEPKATVGQIVNEFKNCSVSIDSTPVRVLRKAIRELVTEDDFQFVHEMDPGDWLLSIPATRGILDELSRAAKPNYWFKILLHLVDGLKLHLETEEIASDKSTNRKWFESRARLVETVMRKPPSASIVSDPELAERIVFEIVSLISKIDRIPSVLWTVDSRKALVNSLVVGVEEDSEYATLLGRGLSHLPDSVPKLSRIAILDSLLVGLNDDLRDSSLRKLWAQSPEIAIESGWRYLSKKLSDEELIDFIIRESSFTDSQNHRGVLSALAEYTIRLSKKHLENRLPMLVKSQISLALQSDGLTQQFRDHLTQNLIRSLRRDQGPESGQELTYVLDVLGGVIDSFTNESDQQYEAKLKVREAEISQLEKDLYLSVVEREKADSLADDIRSSFRVPETWAKSQGELKVLEEIANYYQELTISVHEVTEGSNLWATLKQLEAILAKFEVKTIGEVGMTENFDSKTHLSTAGQVLPGSKVSLLCPGFYRVDRQLSDNRVVLAKAFVKEIQIE